MHTKKIKQKQKLDRLIPRGVLWPQCLAFMHARLCPQWNSPHCSNQIIPTAPCLPPHCIMARPPVLLSNAYVNQVSRKISNLKSRDRCTQLQWNDFILGNWIKIMTNEVAHLHNQLLSSCVSMADLQHWTRTCTHVMHFRLAMLSRRLFFSTRINRNTLILYTLKTKFSETSSGNNLAYNIFTLKQNCLALKNQPGIPTVPMTCQCCVLYFIYSL